MVLERFWLKPALISLGQGYSIYFRLFTEISLASFSASAERIRNKLIYTCEEATE